MLKDPHFATIVDKVNLLFFAAFVQRTGIYDIFSIPKMNLHRASSFIFLFSPILPTLISILYLHTTFIQIVSEVKIEGGYAKPTWRDLVIVKTAMLPYSALQYAKVYHRRYISSAVSDELTIIVLFFFV